MMAALPGGIGDGHAPRLQFLSHQMAKMSLAAGWTLRVDAMDNML